MVLGNHFENLAAQQQTAYSKRRQQQEDRRKAKTIVLSESDAPTKGTPAEEARDVRSAQMAGYRRHKAKEQNDLVCGPYGQQVAPLLATLKALTIDSASALVETVTHAAWIRHTDLATRHAILSLIADAILKLRIRNGLSPFDDAIFDEPPTAFQIIRHGMMGV